MTDQSKRSPHHPVTLRRATDADCTALTRLAMASKAHWGYEDAFMKACEATLTMTPEVLAKHRVVVAQRRAVQDDPAANAGGSDNILGFYVLSRDQPEAEVAQCFVAPAAIGQGVGALLWQDLESASLAQGARALTVLSDLNAAGFYRRMGMKDAGSEPSDVFGAARPLPVLKKTLTG